MLFVFLQFPWKRIGGITLGAIYVYYLYKYKKIYLKALKHWRICRNKEQRQKEEKMKKDEKGAGFQIFR